MEKETIQVFEKEQQTSENKVDDLEKEITQGISLHVQRLKVRMEITAHR